MKLIVGLGNPGREYQGTRHNVGFEAVDELARRHNIHVKARRGRALVGEGSIADQQVLIAKPQTYMNLSGHAVSALARRYKLSADDVMVICDDVNLPLGRLRIRVNGSAGGHNGLKSIIQALGTEEFPRIRIGIGSPRHDLVDHVLNRFNKAERELARELTMSAVDAIQEALENGLESAMNRYNPVQKKPGTLDR